MYKFAHSLFLSLFVVCCFGQKVPENSKTSKFKKEIAALKTYFQIPGLSVLVKEGDQVLYEDYLGWADIDSKTTIDSVTTFQMASLTKIFSAIVVMQLVEENKIMLDEPIVDYLEDVGLDRSVKVKHLLSHTSQGVPGTHFYYNNNRFMLLGPLIEKASGKDFKTNLYERIIHPLGLKNTYLLKDSVQVLAEKRKVAQPYFLGGEPQGGYMIKESIPGFIDYGFSTAAGISSTVSDLAKLSSALDENVLLSSASVSSMIQPFNGDLPYGLGLFTQKFMNEKLVWGYGQYDCYSSLFLKVPERNLTLVMAGNNNLMSDPARLIDGNISYSLFALSFLKNYVLGFESEPLLEDRSSLADITERITDVTAEFYRSKLLAQALAATFMSRYSEVEGLFSKDIMQKTFENFPNYQDYGDLILLRNLFMLKLMDSVRDKEEFTLYDDKITTLGAMLLKKDKYNPYANYYLANFYQIKGRNDQVTTYYQNILNAPNFSDWWYTREAKQWMDNNGAKK